MVRASREYPTLHGETVKGGAPEFVAGLGKTTATALDEFFSWPVFQSAS